MNLYAYSTANEGSVELPQTTSNHRKPPKTTANHILCIVFIKMGWGGGGRGYGRVYQTCI